MHHTHHLWPLHCKNSPKCAKAPLVLRQSKTMLLYGFPTKEHPVMTQNKHEKIGRCFLNVPHR